MLRSHPRRQVHIIEFSQTTVWNVLEAPQGARSARYRHTAHHTRFVAVWVREWPRGAPGPGA
eukprot:4859896-Prymnesium_polylepis.1